MVKLTRGQKVVLGLAAAPMAAVGGTGGYASYVNFGTVLAHRESALGLVVAGEGAVLICALVSLALTLLGQHTPGVVRAGLWLIPLGASSAGAVMASGLNMRITMGITPLAMTAAGEGVALVARRIVAFQTGVDLEQQRRSGLLLWHANRSANGSGIGKWVSTAAVWRLTKQFAATDAQMSVQLGEVQRYRVAEGADTNLHAVLSGATRKGAERPSEGPAAPQLPPAPVVYAPAILTPTEPVPAGTPVAPVAAPGDDGYDFIKGVLAEAEQTVTADPSMKLLTGAEVAALKGVSAGTVRSWSARGKLSVADRDDQGRALYREDDVARMD